MHIFRYRGLSLLRHRPRFSLLDSSACSSAALLPAAALLTRAGRRARAPAKIVGISIAIIAALFLIQQFGTKFVGSLFSPIVMVWLFFNLGARIDGGSGAISSMRFAARGLKCGVCSPQGWCMCKKASIWSI